MIRLTCSMIALSVLLIAAFGCSSTSNPVEPKETSDILSMPVFETVEIGENHSLLGTGTIHFDLENLTAKVENNRNVDMHYNIATMMPMNFTVNSFDPVTMIVDVDVTLTNPYTIDGRDVRLIIYYDSIGHKLMNSDSWTDLYDIPAGLPINPFKAFAKGEVNREFAGLAVHTENLQIRLPGGNPSVTYAVDATFPENCTEPYSIENFYQSYIFDDTSSSTILSVYVYDWQEDVSAVSIHCPWISVVALVPFAQDGAQYWETTLFNNAGVPAGDYPAYLVAWSSNSGSQALYEEVMITVTQDFVVSFPDPNLEQAIRDAIVKPVGDILYSDLVELTEFEANGLSIVNLEGMQYCVNLIDLDLDGNDIVDLSPLGGLYDLAVLELNANQVADLSPIQNLVQLEVLMLYQNLLTNIGISPIQYLTGLKTLTLTDNNISDLTPLQNLENLELLFLSFCQISNITPLQNLTNLRLLHLLNNLLTDITPVQGLYSLTNLGLSNNEIESLLPVANLTNLQNLYISNTTTDDITPLENLTSLKKLEATSNSISNLTPLDDLILLNSLYLETNLITVITPLEDLTNMKYLHLYNNQISNLTPLEGMTLLKNLKLENNLISDISSLEPLTSLIFIHLTHNQIADILPLVNNPGIDTGDDLDLIDNPLNDDSINIYIPELESRGVTVRY